MKISKLIEFLQEVEHIYGPDTQVRQKNFAVCSEESPVRVTALREKIHGRRGEDDEPVNVVIIESGRYVDYLEDPDA